MFTGLSDQSYRTVTRLAGTSYDAWELGLVDLLCPGFCPGCRLTSANGEQCLGGTGAPQGLGPGSFRSRRDCAPLVCAGAEHPGCLTCTLLADLIVGVRNETEDSGTRKKSPLLRTVSHRRPLLTELDIVPKAKRKTESSTFSHWY